jgi:hypothetical protein
MSQNSTKLIKLPTLIKVAKKNSEKEWKRIQSQTTAIYHGIRYEHGGDKMAAVRSVDTGDS